MKTKKPSEVFEGENSSLRKTFDEATKKANKECCDKCTYLIGGLIHGNREVCRNNDCHCHCRICGEVLREQNEKEEFNEDAKVIDMLEEEEEKYTTEIEHCDEPQCPECDKAAYERGRADERTALVEEIKREAEYFRNNLSTENLNEEYEQFINLLTKK